MDSRLIMTFLRLVKVGQITATARSLGAQSEVVIKQIDQLQKQVGVTLVKYHNIESNVSLTQNGQRFIPIARTYLRLSQDTVDLKETDHYDQLTIASSIDINTGILLTNLTKIMSKDPFVHYTVTNASNDEIYASVRNETVDVGFSYERDIHQNIVLQDIGKDPLVVVTGCQSDYPDVVFARELERTNELYVPWSSSYKEWHARYWDCIIQPLLTTDCAIQLPNYINAANAWAIMPKSFLQTVDRKQIYFRRLYLLEEIPELTLFAIKKEDCLLKQSLIDWFILQIRELFSIPIIL